MLTLSPASTPVARGPKNLLSAQTAMATARPGEPKPAEALLREMAFVYHLTRSIRNDITGQPADRKPR